MPAYTNATQLVPLLFQTIVEHHHKMDAVRQDMAVVIAPVQSAVTVAW